MSSIKSVCICGAGTMGSGIAQVVASSGFPTLLFDVHPETLQKAKQKIETDLQKLVDKQKLSLQEKTEIIQRISFVNHIEDCKADLLIEAIVENPVAKRALFEQLVALNPKSIFASNTSSLSLTKLADCFIKKENFLGLHFFNPATLMKLVEIVKTEFTSEQTVTAATEFSRLLNKIPVVCKDAPGFIVNRIARPFYIEALRLLEEKKASVEVIDKIMEALGFKMGPFKLMDLIGNDVNYAVSCSVYEQLGKPERLRPSPIQKEKVEKGELGRKTARGYYEY